MSSQSAGIPCTHPKGLQEWSRGTEDIWEKQAAARCYWENGETEMQTLPWSQASIASTWGQFLVAGQMKHSRIGSLYVGFLIQIIISLLVTSTSKTKANLSQTFFFFCHFRSVSPVGICIWKIVFELILSLKVSISTYFFNTFFSPPKKSYDSNSQAVASSLCFQLPGLQLRGVANALDGLWELWSTGGALLISEDSDGVM